MAFAFLDSRSLHFLRFELLFKASDSFFGRNPKAETSFSANSWDLSANFIN